MRGRDLIGLANLVIVAGIIGAISFVAFTLRPAEYDAQTLCIVGETHPHRVVIIDKTDLYSPAQAGAIRELILLERDYLAVNEQLSLYELDEQGRLANSNRFSLCNPGSGEQVNPLYRNPDRIQTRYEALFAGPLDRALSDLVEPKNAPQSPIVEALAELAASAEFGRDIPGRRIILVSDMLQNSNLFSVYGRRGESLRDRLPDPRAIADAVRAQYGDGLWGVEIEIRLIPRERWTAEQAEALPAYWEEVFLQLGARVYWSSLPGDALA